MRQQIITNKPYKIILLVITIYSLITRIYSLIKTGCSFLGLIPIILGTLLILYVVWEHHNTRKLIKIGFGLSVLGSTFSLLGIFLLAISKDYEKLNLNEIINNILLLGISLYIFIGSDKYIIDVDENEIDFNNNKEENLHEL